MFVYTRYPAAVASHLGALELGGGLHKLGRVCLVGQQHRCAADDSLIGGRVYGSVNPLLTGALSRPTLEQGWVLHQQRGLRSELGGRPMYVCERRTLHHDRRWVAVRGCL